VLMSFEAKSLLPHAFYLLVERIHFFAVPFVRLGSVALAQFIKRFLD
jgi:hypothetical protein